MFDFSQLADMSRLANEAVKFQKEQKISFEKQIILLHKISSQLEEVIRLLREKR